MKKFLKFITERDYSKFDVALFLVAGYTRSIGWALTIIFVGLIISAVLEAFADN